MIYQALYVAISTKYEAFDTTPERSLCMAAARYKNKLSIQDILVNVIDHPLKIAKFVESLEPNVRQFPKPNPIPV
jgi:hypothetical protein